MVVQDQIVGQLPGLFGALARRVAIDDLDLVRFVVRPLEGLAMQRLVGLDALLELGAHVAKARVKSASKPTFTTSAGTRPAHRP